MVPWGALCVVCVWWGEFLDRFRLFLGRFASESGPILGESHRFWVDARSILERRWLVSDRFLATRSILGRRPLTRPAPGPLQIRSSGRTQIERGRAVTAASTMSPRLSAPVTPQQRALSRGGSRGGFPGGPPGKSPATPRGVPQGILCFLVLWGVP